MTAEIIPFPTKPKFSEGEISPLLGRPPAWAIPFLPTMAEVIETEARLQALLDLHKRDA